MTGQQPYEGGRAPGRVRPTPLPCQLVAKVGAAGSFDEAPIRAFGPPAGYINGATRSRRSGREPRRPRRSCISPPADPAVSCACGGTAGRGRRYWRPRPVMLPRVRR